MFMGTAVTSASARRFTSLLVDSFISLHDGNDDDDDGDMLSLQVLI